MGGGAGVSSQGIIDNLRKVAQMGVSDEDCLMLDAANRIEKLEKALERIRDCNWVITLPDRMDAVRAIAREALE